MTDALGPNCCQWLGSMAFTIAAVEVLRVVSLGLFFILGGLILGRPQKSSEGLPLKICVGRALKDRLFIYVRPRVLHGRSIRCRIERRRCLSIPLQRNVVVEDR